MIGRVMLSAAALVLFPADGATQSHAPRIEGTWKAETAEGPRDIIVRSDSSASFGDEIVRWRIVADSIFIALGGEWLVYNFAVRGRTLTLSGGDLVDPITLTRIGPATPRPEGVAVPPAPPMDKRAFVASETR